MKRNLLFIVAAALAAGLHSLNAQIIVNGGFESPNTPTYVWIGAGQKTIAPWVVGLDSVEVGDAIGNGFLVGAAFEGGQYLDLNGTGRGRIRQTFPTTPGLLYTLTFAYTDNYYQSSISASARVRLFDGQGDRLNQTITHNDAVAGDYRWVVFNGQFTAVQNTTTLEFASLTDSGGHTGGIMLDAVQVHEGGLPVVAIRTSQVELCWSSESNLTYQVQYRSALTTNLWTSLLDCVRSTGSRSCVYDQVAVGEPQRFYRVVPTSCTPRP